MLFGNDRTLRSLNYRGIQDIVYNLIETDIEGHNWHHILLHLPRLMLGEDDKGDRIPCRSIHNLYLDFLTCKR